MSLREKAFTARRAAVEYLQGHAIKSRDGTGGLIRRSRRIVGLSVACTRAARVSGVDQLGPGVVWFWQVVAELSGNVTILCVFNCRGLSNGLCVDFELVGGLVDGNGSDASWIHVP